tara:strand:- start:1909 stop:3333 length:1425 start_codon:yes stop_codon:yes gene_type:complete
MKKIKRNNIWIVVLCFFLILGSARFIYSTSFKSNVSLFNTSHGIKSIINSVITDFDNIEFHNRRWGPIGVGIVLNGIKTFDPDVITKKEYTKWPISSRKSYPSFVWRLTQFITYGISIYFLLSLISDFQPTTRKEKNYNWSTILIFVSLQSSAAIYDINNAGGGMFTAFFIIGHFYFFHKKKYFFAAIFILIGIYYRLHPIVFAFPFFVFACFSKNHRKYIYYLFLIGSFIAIVSYPIQGFKYGSLYPLSVIYHIGAEPFTSVPVTSQEVINPLALIYKIINGFQINRTNFIPSKFLSFITSSFIILFILSNILAGYILSKFENKWKNNDQLRLLYLFFFQIIIGYLYLIFSFDVSIEHLLNSLISIFAPILLFSITINKLNSLYSLRVVGFIFFYFIGLSLVGGLLPISIVSVIIPFDLIDKMVGDDTTHIGQYGRFIWYHIPLLGLLIIGVVTYFYAKYLLKFSKSKFPRNI